MSTDSQSQWRQSHSLEEWSVTLLPALFCLGYVPTLFLFPGFTTRLALLAAFGAPGLVKLASLALSGDGPARAATWLAGWVLIAALFSGAPVLALKGAVGLEFFGGVLVLGLGLWAIGRLATPWVTGGFRWSLLVGLGTNAAVGALQFGLSLDTGGLARQFGRSTGLTPNPVYFGALMAAGAALTAGWQSWRLVVRFGAVFVFAFALDLSGSRVALGAGLLAVVAASLVDASLRRGVAVAALPAAFVAGVGVSTLASRLDDNLTSTGRLGGDGSGGRLEAWSYGVRAALDSPLVGNGLGRFRAATQDRFSADFVRSAASDDVSQSWFDAHNVIIGLLVGLGVVGLALAGWFVVSACRSSVDRQLLLVVGAVSVTWLMQPVALATFPIVMLTLGVAAAAARQHVRFERPVRLAGQFAALVGVLVAGWLIVADLRLNAAVERSDLRAVEQAAAAFPGDPVIADLVAQAFTLQQQLLQPSLDYKVVEWSERAVDRDPSRPYLWRQHASRMFAIGREDEAVAALETAIDLQPWHLQSWQLMYAIGEAIGDDELVERAGAKLCRLGDDRAGCPTE